MKAKALAKPAPPETILLAVTGMSPAVLTETVWALAQERPATIPDRVVAVTTAQGRGCIERELFAPSPGFGGAAVWEAMRAALARKLPAAKGKLRFGTTGDDIRVFTAPDGRTGRSVELDDISTAEANARAADFILDQVRSITQNPDRRLIASMAGGRKTMGALLYAAMCLLGRGGDRLTHVLVNEPFDSPGLKPRFYFPVSSQVHQLCDRSGKKLSAHPARGAKLQLADVPFVRLHRLFPQQFGRLPGNFSALVELYSDKIAKAAAKPEVRLCADELALFVDGLRVELDFREWCAYSYFLDRLRRGAPANVIQNEQADDLREFLERTKAERQSLLLKGHKDWSGAIIDDLRRKVSTLKKKFEAHGLQASIPDLLPNRRRFSIVVKDISAEGRSGRSA